MDKEEGKEEEFKEDIYIKKNTMCQEMMMMGWCVKMRINTRD
jgi:hypothetical protein